MLTESSGNKKINTREIDQEAQNIFKSILPSKWLFRKQDPDIHVDYFVEIAEMEPSGVTFGVQLKGTNSATYKDTMVKYEFETKHLSYYLDKVKQPIFIIVVDVNSKKGFWLFTQKWAKEELKIKNWRKQKNIDIKIPQENCLSDLKYFKEEIINAEKYMRELWPSSILAAIKYEKESLESLDHRLKVDISYHEDKCIYNFKALEPLQICIRLNDAQENQDKIVNLIERGETATFEKEEITKIEGFPLFETVEIKKLLVSSKRVPIALTLSLTDLSKNEKRTLFGAEGIISGGLKEAKIEGSFKETPLNISLSLPIAISLTKFSSSGNFKFNAPVWENIPMLELPFFEKLREFFLFMQDGHELKIEGEIKGNHLFTLITGSVKPIMFIKSDLQLLEKIRTIGKAINVNFLFPKDGLSNDEIDTINLLYQLIVSGERRQNGQGVNFKLKLLPNEIKNFIKANSEDSSGPLIIEPKDPFLLLEKEFNFGYKYTLTNPILVTNLSDIIKDIDETRQEGIEIELVGSSESELIISKI